MTRERTHRRHRAIWIALGVVAVLIVAAAAVVVPRIVGDASEQAGLAQWREQPAGALTGAPGSLIKSEPLQGLPFDADAWRVMYRTTDLTGATVAVTGIVVTPRGEAPAGGRTVLAWGHPTTGTAAKCAPSFEFDPYIPIEGMSLLLDRGYTIVATDYVGLGTDGPNSYLIGETAGNAVLDSVRAAQQLPDAQAGSDVVLWGHSQGGQAVLFAAQQAPDYAPELDVLAVAAAAPAADLTALMGDHLDDISGVTIGSYAFGAFSEVYADRGATLESILTPEAIAVLPKVNEYCLLTSLDTIHEIAQPVVGKFVTSDPTKTEPWATLLTENSAGAVAFEAPLFLAQGLKDTLVLPSATETFSAHAQSIGIDVTLHKVPEADHGTVAYLAMPALMGWLDAQGV